MSGDSCGGGSATADLGNAERIFGRRLARDEVVVLDVAVGERLKVGALLDGRGIVAEEMAEAPLQLQVFDDRLPVPDRHDTGDHAALDLDQREEPRLDGKPRNFDGRVAVMAPAERARRQHLQEGWTFDGDRAADLGVEV